MKDTKIQAFEYTMYKAIEWYMETKNNFEVKNFHLLNDFSKRKIELLPFFIFAASNNREELIKILNKFTCGETGIIEKDISDKIWENFESANFDFFNQTNITTTIYEKYIDSKGLLDKNKLEDYFKSNLELKNRNLIDYSIDALKNKNNNFINLEPEVFSFYSERHIAWQVFKNNNSKTLENIIIPKEILLNERSVFATKENLISFS